MKSRFCKIKIMIIVIHYLLFQLCDSYTDGFLQQHERCKVCDLGRWCEKPCDRTVDGCEMEVCGVSVRCHGHKVKCRPSDGKVKVVLRGDGKINTMQSCHIPEITGCGLIGISFC